MENLKIPGICKDIASLHAEDFILMEQNIKASVGPDKASALIAENNKKVLDVFKVLFLTIRTARQEKEELTTK